MQPAMLCSRWSCPNNFHLNSNGFAMIKFAMIVLHSKHLRANLAGIVSASQAMQVLGLSVEMTQMQMGGLMMVCPAIRRLASKTTAGTSLILAKKTVTRMGLVMTVIQMLMEMESSMNRIIVLSSRTLTRLILTVTVLGMLVTTASTSGIIELRCNCSQTEKNSYLTVFPKD